MFRLGLVGIVVALTLTGCNEAGPLQRGVAAYKQGDYQAAHELFRPLAEQGNASAQYNLGIWHRNVAEDNA